MNQGFLRRDASRFSKLGKRRKKIQRWKKPTGRDNKMREKKKGYPKVVSIGYSVNRKTRGTLNKKNPVRIDAPSQLEKLKKTEIAIVGNVGKKKKIEIAKKAEELNVEVYNINPKAYLKKNVLKDKKRSSENKETKKEDNKK